MNRERLEAIGKLLLRVLVGGLLLFHGYDKVVNGLGDIRADLAEHGLPGVMAYGVYVSEVMAPLCVIAGAWTRLAALVYSGGIFFAVALVHANDFLRLAPTGGWAAELFVFYIVSALVVALVGPGPYAIRRAEWPWE